MQRHFDDRKLESNSTMFLRDSLWRKAPEVTEACFLKLLLPVTGFMDLGNKPRAYRASRDFPDPNWGSRKEWKWLKRQTEKRLSPAKVALFSVTEPMPLGRVSDLSDLMSSAIRFSVARLPFLPSCCSPISFSDSCECESKDVWGTCAIYGVAREPPFSLKPGY